MTRDEVLAMPAGPELDVLVAERVMCLQRIARPAGPPGMISFHFIDTKRQYTDGNSPGYSTNIASAWEVMERLGGVAFGVFFNSRFTDQWRAGFETVLGAEVYAVAPTAPLAICRAALLTTLEREQQ